MIAVRIGPDLRIAVVFAPTYFERRPTLEKRQDHPLKLHPICACRPS
jgi:hypothetical protein